MPGTLPSFTERSPAPAFSPVSANDSRRGFTLIELLVVIAIIALLIGILLPALGKARNSARTMKCLSNVKSMATSLALYAGEYKSWYPVVPVANSGESETDMDKEDAAHIKKRWGRQHKYGGLAGFFTLNQQGQGGPDNTSAICYVRKRFGQPDPFYSDRVTKPVLAKYMDGFGALICPSDREDRRYSYHLATSDFWDGNKDYYMGAPAANSVYVPKVPSTVDEIAAYNLSYMYYAGFKTDEPNVVSAVPIWGDDTNGPDVGTLAFYNSGNNKGADNGYLGAQSIGPNYYGKVDNHGRDGGNFMFSDGHGELINGNIQSTFFDPMTSGKAVNTARNVNAILPYRSNWIQAVD
ncbi:MAG: prepilin-type N-terminal cleavage/methylation domain-containing protein [Phycisphaerales bacterium]